MKVKSYEELVAWQKAMLLAKTVYGVQKQLPKEEVYGLGDQIRRAVVSVPSNIAEGFGRETDKDFRHFLSIARGSLYETKTQLELAESLGFLQMPPELVDLFGEVVGELVGLSAEDVRRINQLVSNVASQSVRDPVSLITENIAVGKARTVVAIHVEEGNDKPYFDGKGVVWMKEGADKRRVVSKDEIRRLFEASYSLPADEQSTRATIADLDIPRLSTFFAQTYGMAFPRRAADRVRMLKNLNLADERGFLNLGGLLMFGKHPEFIVPQFGVKAVRLDGVSLAAMSYSDSEDYGGCLGDIYKGAMAFVMRNLHKRQGAGGVNMPGTSEIPSEVIEELLVNALLHRDYFVSAPIRVLIFDDRVEIISPGSLPNHLTVEKILAGNSNIRNPVLASFVAKGILPYHGLGSGVMRVMELCPNTKFVDDKEGVQFKAIVPRVPTVSTAMMDEGMGAVATEMPTEEVGLLKSSQKSSQKIIEIISQRPEVTTSDIADALGISRRAVAKHIATLRYSGVVRRVGPDKGGHWEVMGGE